MKGVFWMENIMKQMDMTRTFLLMGAEKITEENADIIPAGFPNSLRWQLGHVLVSFEYIVFHMAGEEVKLPEGYSEMFTRGTSPKDWTADPPKVAELKELLSEQMGRFKDTFGSRLDETIEETFKAGPVELNTIGELILFALFHESEHGGCIKGLHRAIKGAN